MSDSININIDYDLEIHNGVLQYVSDSRYAKQLWEKRGISGHNNSKEIDHLHNQLNKEVMELMENDIVQQRLRGFVNESLGLMDAIISGDKDVTAKYITNKEFYFVLGATRTGGTYMLKEISAALHWPFDHLLQSMVHDSIPYSTTIMGDDFIIGQNNKAWRKPENYFNFIFQVAQFLVYIHHVVPEKKKVVVKHAYFCFCLALVDEIFGENANYLITVRHPAAQIASRTESRNLISTNLDFRESFFKDWENFYFSLLLDGKPAGTLTPLLYGEEMDLFLESFFSDQGHGAKPEGIKITSRNYDTNYWCSPEVEDRIHRISKFWELQGVEFPYPAKIQ